MKANPKTAEENMIFTCRILSFWNEFLQQEYIDNGNEGKQTTNQYQCHNFIDWLKRFYLHKTLFKQMSWKQSEKEQMKWKICNLYRKQYQCTRRMFQSKKVLLIISLSFLDWNLWTIYGLYVHLLRHLAFLNKNQK